MTIFLEETLATSRLINGFPEPPPGIRRLVNQAIAQRERLKGVSNAVIVGAAAAGGFRIAVPDADAKKDGEPSLNAEPQPDGRSR